MSTYRELKKQAQVLAARIEQARQEEVQSVIVRIRELASDYDLMAEDIFGPRQTKIEKRPRRTVSVKYWNPVTGATWSGRGREPTWIKGQDRESFLIQT
ncbi:H-NS histone family protein [Burkholderia sp. Ac-20345]|uniref:H-NS histone family protein n=1 Tax=Burkholderia sp. Ac-20345 TaxID=2703891 RepID=UPI00197BCF27|nr:H-NS histone family protein [Burkholderia sp. Ac-20345]MBN3781035.1 H-NS histone family protein [Burkholderia sp. Ac-20345]